MLARKETFPFLHFGYWTYVAHMQTIHDGYFLCISSKDLLKIFQDEKYSPQKSSQDESLPNDFSLQSVSSNNPQICQTSHIQSRFIQSETDLLDRRSPFEMRI